MNKNMFRLITLVGGILLTIIGTLWAIKVLPSQAAQPIPPLADLLLQTSDLPDCGLGCEEVRHGLEDAKEGAEAFGLPPDYQEGVGVYFLAYTYPFPKAVVQALYRYENEEKATARYEQLLEAFPLSPLGRGTPIIGQFEWSFKGVKGHMIETQDPSGGTLYWFIGVRGKLLTIIGVLSFDSTGQPFFKELLPIALGRIEGAQ